jgi:hypothetical protein
MDTPSRFWLNDNDESVPRITEDIRSEEPRTSSAVARITRNYFPTRSTIVKGDLPDDFNSRISYSHDHNYRSEYLEY